MITTVPSSSASAFPETKQGEACLLGLYFLPVLLTCAWVWSLPVFPSQDGPLHLYYVNALRQLLAHRPGVYMDAYTIKSYVTPYSVYYYSLIGLGKFVRLETADKIMICLYVLLFATATRTLIRSVTKGSAWAPFCTLPVLLNWPLMMGFVNYSLSTCLACFALAAWCSGIGRPEPRYRIAFLLLIALMMVTHPVPWLIVLGFVWFELGVRLIHSRFAPRRHSEATELRFWRLDVLTALLACLPTFYILHFNGMVQTVEPEGPPAMPALHFLSPGLLPFLGRAQQFLRTFGVDIYAGNELLPRLYRLAISVLLFAILIAAVTYLLRRRRGNTWSLAHTWLLFSLSLLPFLLFLPDKISDHYYFVSRLGILFFVSCVTGGSLAIQGMRKLGMSFAAFAYVLSMMTLAMAVRYITPVARSIASLSQAPAVPSTKHPGLLMQSPGFERVQGLDFLPNLWAGAHYFRQHNLLLYNTAWLGDPIILVGVRPGRLRELDATYYEGVPFLPSRMFLNGTALANVLDKVNLTVIMRQGAPEAQNPLADTLGATVPGAYAKDWTCIQGKPNAWSLCLPPEQNRSSRR